MSNSSSRRRRSSTSAGTFEALLHQSAQRAIDVALAAAANAGTSNRSLCACLLELRTAWRSHELEATLRIADRYWRTLPEHSSQLAPIYARLLALDGSDTQASLRMLARAAEAFPDGELAALTVRTLLQVERFAEAQGELELAFARFCTPPDGLLASVATRMLDHLAVPACGWIAVGPALDLHGVLSRDDEAPVLDIRRPDGAAFVQLIRTRAAGNRLAFRFSAPAGLSPSGLDVSSRGERLLGGSVALPLQFALDGRAHSEADVVLGWARLGWDPGRALRLRIEDEHAVRVQGRASPSFRIHRGRAPLRGDRLTISVRLPDGRWQSLPDAPLLLERALRGNARRPARIAVWEQLLARRRTRPVGVRRASVIDVIIPVYRGREEALACIDSALATVAAPHQVIVVDDATPDASLAAALDDYASAGRITLLRNPINLGFVGSVNRALQLHPAHDAVLLNADAQVTGDWLSRLRRTAYSAPDIATVTPFSNSGSIASYGDELIDATQAAALDALIARCHAGQRSRIPVGVGFCLYLRRDCLQQIGPFDIEAFARGYGEETDYCLRAQARGWSHWLAADVFVYHAGGRSFGAQRAALLDRSQRLINLRHPGYDDLIRGFLRQDPLSPLRRLLDEQRLAMLPARFALFVTLALAGGVDRVVAERVREARERGLLPLVLRPSAEGTAATCEIWTDALPLQNLRYRVPSDLKALQALLHGLPLDTVEIHHFLHLDARVIELVRGLTTPYDVYVHDYTWYCPRVTLMGSSGRYCGEPDLDGCNACVRRQGSRLDESISVAALRSRSARWLTSAARVVAPSIYAAERMQRRFPGVAIDVQPLSTVRQQIPLGARDAPDGVVRVALIGALGDHKGYQVLLRCARDARARRLPLQFVVVGYTQDDAPLLRTGKVAVTGRYTEGEIPYLLQRERPDVAFYASVFPETWCYALDHALAADLPIVAFDLGAIGERLSDRDRVTLLPLELSAREINDTLLRRAANPEELMTQSSDKASKQLTTQPAAMESSPQDSLSASLQLLPLPPGLYLFSVQAGSPKSSPVSGSLSLPAVFVALGPGVPSDQVEFVEGPGSKGNWLFAQGDLLVVKVNGPATTLLLSSVRAPGGDVLSIRVERLEARAAGADPAPALPEPAAAAAPVDPNQVSLQVAAHVRSRGDLSFTDALWAGRVAPGLWIESFSIRPLSRLAAQDVEYKGLTGSGFETPWMSNEQSCGTKGMAVPLVGFAVRLKAGVGGEYDCEYSGYFASGAVVGPLRNGAPCRSTVANDPLEGLQIRIVRRADVPTLSAAAAIDEPDAGTSTKTRRAAAARGDIADRSKRASSRRS